MPNLNRVQIMGNLGQEPEMRFTPSGAAVTNFRLAVNRFYTDANGDKIQETEWISCVAWNKQAETINQYVSKGNALFVEGRLRTRSWQDDKGNTRYKTEVIVSNFQFLQPRQQELAPQEQEAEAELDEPVVESVENTQKRMVDKAQAKTQAQSAARQKAARQQANKPANVKGSVRKVLSRSS